MKKLTFIGAIGFVLFSVIFFIFYPPTYAVVDEAEYLTQAYAFQNGTIFYDKLGINQSPMGLNVNGHHISKYWPGNAALIVPFSAMHWKLVFLRGLILMGIGFFVFMLLLHHLKLPRIYALLFLLHPSFVLYSRTMLSDIPVTIIALAGLFFLLKEKAFAAGLILALGMCVRLTLSFIVISFAIVLITEKRWREFIWLSAGVAFGFVPLVIYNIVGFHKITGSISMYGIDFGLHFFGRMFLKYTLGLTVLYPLLLFVALFSKINRRWLFIVPALGFILFHSFQGFMDAGSNIVESLVMGLRFMLPIIPFLLIPYIHTISKKKVTQRIILPFCGILFLFSIMIHWKHQGFLKRQLQYRDEVYRFTNNAELVICNKEVFELYNPYIAYVPWAPFEEQGKLLPVEEYRHSKKNIYFACIARDDTTKILFQQVLKAFPDAAEIHTSHTPYFFTIWRK